ncbi:MAG: hypothetical protein NTX87_05475, partial [Planctomycetota bacterium]|nr:hypothetical protein [Planctomycetota bacterium]
MIDFDPNLMVFDMHSWAYAVVDNLLRKSNAGTTVIRHLSLVTCSHVGCVFCTHLASALARAIRVNNLRACGARTLHLPFFAPTGRRIVAAGGAARR